MDVFALSEEITAQYSAFARSFTTIRSRELKDKVDQLYANRQFWPEPLLQLNPHFEDGGTVQDLVGVNGLSKECAKIFIDHRLDASQPDRTLKLRKHQAQAIGLALQRKSFVVTTGTGSGKSLCFFIPIIDAIAKAKKTGEKRTRAVVVYPMNALANSQMEELRKFLPESGPIESRITFERYTGQEDLRKRQDIRKDPPDILLTNFMMLELLMTRQNEIDCGVIANCKGLEFLVLDELHTYRGRQGADVGMLMRRFCSRVGDPARPPVFIGTSATMASEEAGADSNQLVADVATKLFGEPISRSSIITETLRRATDPKRSAQQCLEGLAAAVEAAAANSNAYWGRTNADIGRDPLAIWVETRLGLDEVEKKPKRAKPITVAVAATLLSQDSGLPESTCTLAIRNALLAFSLNEADRGVAGGDPAPLFAFKLHQFFSGAGRLYATLDPLGSRSVTFDGQIFDPSAPEKRLYSTHFCRNCGQEHHPVILTQNEKGERQFLRREIDDVPDFEDTGNGLDGEQWGFLMPEPVDGEFTFTGQVDSYPEAWWELDKNGEPQFKSSHRKNKAELVQVLPDGVCRPGGARAWFMPRRFQFCPACGDYHSDSARDINRLAALSAEGRSSATTVIISQILRWMNEPQNGMARFARKLLAFTDNRQDAALQAGHFNDFIFVTLFRGAVLAVLEAAGSKGIQEDQVGQAIQKALDFVGENRDRRTEWLVEPELKGANLLNAERSLREAFAHRFWIDQRRGWRYTNPNLEQLGLIEVDYLSIDDMAAETKAYEQCPVLAQASIEERKKAATVLFDALRKGLAIECDALDRSRIESLSGRMRGVIQAPWAIEDGRIMGATLFLPHPPARKEITQEDEALLLRGSPGSATGKQLKRLYFGGRLPSSRDIAGIIDCLLAVAKEYGIVTTASSSFGGEGWRLVPSAVVFKRRTSQTGDKSNPFFAGLYTTIAGLLARGGSALFGFEGREHTAQVDGDIRELREARFRYEEKDQKLLAEKSDQLRERRESPRFLPTLFCSPTMELGVDISAMSSVYLRNVPPTPANYAQRSGRAGRSGQAALIITYCSAQSPHDQYFFNQPAAMVAGIVLPPSIDLRNPELVKSHLYAEWLAGTGLELDPSIAKNLEMTDADRPLLAEHRRVIELPEAKETAEARVWAFLKRLEADYGDNPPEGFDASELAMLVLDSAPSVLDRTFDRWRNLLAAAERQRDAAGATLADYSISSQERKAAEARQAAANTQIKLLLAGGEGQGTDFYVYRYLATEGFIPGYNFPRLPLMAFIPGTSDGKGERYIQRARFLAISEFGPRSLVYHEGRAYRVDRALLKETGTGAEGRLATFSTTICARCGAAHDNEPPERCHLCRHSLSSAAITRDLHRIDNVGTRAIERITANDEERQRQGFDILTTFEFLSAKDVKRRQLVDAEGELLAADFAPAALVRRINRGLRRRKDPAEIGFTIDPRTGYWIGDEEPNTAKKTGPARLRQRITPVVEDQKNALLIRLPQTWLESLDDESNAVVTTIQHALLRGLEQHYQLEEGEVMVEPTPGRENRMALLFYEAAEGGAGALSRMVETDAEIRAVAAKALELLHFAPESIAGAIAGQGELQDSDGCRCVAGCYRCLLSYYNQPDQAIIDRRLKGVREFLVRLAKPGWEFEKQRAGEEFEFELPDCPPPDVKPLVAGGVEAQWIWRDHRVVAVHAADCTSELEALLKAKGLTVIPIPQRGAERESAFERLAELLGRRDA